MLNLFCMPLFVYCHGLDMKCLPKGLLCWGLDTQVELILERWLDPEGSDFISGLIPDRFLAWQHYWEAVGRRRHGLGGGSRLLGACPGKIYPGPGPFLSAPWPPWGELPCTTVCVHPWCFASAQACILWAVELTDYGLKPLILWARINLYSFTLFLSGICHSHKKSH
jgi:hypothetical protein